MFETAPHSYVHPVASQERPSVQCAGYCLKLDATSKQAPAVVCNRQRKLRSIFLGGKYAENKPLRGTDIITDIFEKW